MDHINLSKIIEGGIFKFNIELTKASSEQFWEEVTKKLCDSVAVLTHKNKLLTEIIKNKDKEILEYKLEGAQLIRSKYIYLYIFY